MSKWTVSSLLQGVASLFKFLYIFLVAKPIIFIHEILNGNLPTCLPVF